MQITLSTHELGLVLNGLEAEIVKFEEWVSTAKESGNQYRETLDRERLHRNQLLMDRLSSIYDAAFDADQKTRNMEPAA